ncbi:mammalian ependymin-related protein 1-like [Babylonia areolata]|uniref:mammalian ependymin-related protein 1-like n=1 Tax=Babylonia areolata TaxID=304850 RepID=UPI003FD1B8B7
MMKGTVAVCVVLAVLVMTACPAAGDGPACCSPDKWEGRQLSTFMNSEVTYDAVNQREVFIVNKTDSNGNSKQFKYLAFYGKNVAYTYDLNDGSCRESALTAFPKRCVPDSSKVLNAKLTLGTGSNTVSASRVYYETKAGGTTTYGNVVLADGCVPIFETALNYVGGVLSMESSTYEDIREGIKSEDIFDLPKACQEDDRRRRSDDVETLDEEISALMRLP